MDAEQQKQLIRTVGRVVTILGVVALATSHGVDAYSALQKTKQDEIKLGLASKDVELKQRDAERVEKETERIAKEAELKRVAENTQLENDMSLRLLDRILANADQFYPSSPNANPASLKKRSLVLGAFPDDLVSRVFSRAEKWAAQPEKEALRAEARRSIPVRIEWVVGPESAVRAVTAKARERFNVISVSHDSAPNAVPEPEIRYFSDLDQSLASELAEELRGTPGMANVRVKSGANMVRRPVSGVLEVWFP